MTKEEQQKDDIETMKILFNADINELCNQRRFNDAREMEEIRDRLIEALEQTRWIPIKTRPMTEEEKEEIGHEYAYMYDCLLPDDGQDVLITDCHENVEIDTFCRDYEGCYFEVNCDDGEVIAWMPLPKPYKEDEK